MLARKSNGEEVCFEGGFEDLESGGISEGFREGIPEGRGSKGKSSVAPCAEFCLRDDEKVCITGSEGARGDMTLEEVTEVRGSQVIECFVGGQKCFEVYPLFDW